MRTSRSRPPPSVAGIASVSRAVTAAVIDFGITPAAVRIVMMTTNAAPISVLVRRTTVGSRDVPTETIIATPTNANEIAREPSPSGATIANTTTDRISRNTAP